MKYLILILLFSSCNILKIITGSDSNLDDNFLNKGLWLEVYPEYYYGHRTIYVDDEIDVRTLNVDFPKGASLSCSTDNGSTFFDCTDHKFVWDVANFNSNHIIRAKLNDQEIEKSFIPSNHMPNTTFVSCNHNISVNESIDDFNGNVNRTIVAGEVVCVDNGVEITGSSTLSNLPSGVILISRQMDFAKIISDIAGSIVSISAQDVKIVGFDIFGKSNPSDIANQVGIDLSASAQIEDCYIQLEGASAIGMNFSAAGDVTLNGISMSIFSNDSHGIKIFDTNVNIYDSYISSGNISLYFQNSIALNTTLNIYDSEIFSFKDVPAAFTPGVIQSSTNNTGFNIISLNRTRIVTDTGAVGILVDKTSGATQLQINDTKFVNNNLGTISNPAIRFNADTQFDSVNFNANSIICNLGTNSTFDLIVSLNNNAFTFDASVMNAHTDNTSIGICPVEDQIPPGTGG